MTREHYISESILAFFDELQVDNIPFLKGRCKALSISPSSLCSKVLCDKHNSFLSPLDSMAGELFGFMHRFGINDRKLMTVSGDSIEKWLCKVLMGYLSSGNVEHEGKKFSEKDIPQELISFVFLNQSLPVEWGLYSLYHIGQIIRNDEQKKFHMGPVFLNGKVMGLQVKMGFLDLMLALDKKDVVFRKDHPGYSMLIHKIRKIEYTRDSSTKYVEIKWKLLS